ncbi:MAG: hypothetical protein QOD75_2809 [Blastocatellia bacterium]|nr:hypothetical protein [Blastocatellia bacterium]
MRALIIMALTVLAPFCVAAQDKEEWPSLAYLRSDYKAVSVVAHIRIREAKITNRIPGYENWRIRGEVLESFKGKFRKGNVIEYFHGAEAGFPQRFFAGEKIVFLLSEYDKQASAMRYSVLENSSLPPTPGRLSKLRVIKRKALSAKREAQSAKRKARSAKREAS